MNWLIPEASFAEHALVVVVALGVTALVVSIHYAGVNWLARRYLESKTKSGRARRTMLKIIFTLIGLHIVEIWCYGMAFWTLSFVPGTGYLHGEHGTNTMFDAVYLSATTYSTVGRLWRSRAGWRHSRHFRAGIPDRPVVDHLVSQLHVFENVAAVVTF